jgi:carbon monoxide dehydrogenase subunit G
VEFSNSFTVEAPLDRVWAVLIDPREVTPCVPGAQITEMIDESHFQGTVKVKLGAVQMSYRGTMEMQPDEASHTIVLQGKGTATGGGGGASGKVTVTVTGSDGGTTVDILSQVDVTGRVAQFGRGIMQDVSNRLIKEFASCLQQKLATVGQEETRDTETAPSVQAVEAPAPSAAGVGPESAEGQPATVKVPAQPAAAGVSSPPTASPSAPAPAGGTTTASAAENELKLTTLLLDITRTKIAEGLRALAKRIEPS